MESRFLMKILFRSSLGTPFYQKNIEIVPSEPRKTMKNLGFLRFFKVSQFSCFGLFCMFFCSKMVPRGSFWAPRKPHKGTQRAPKRCLRRPPGAAGGVLLLPLSHLEGPQIPFLTLHGGSKAQFGRFGRPNMDFSCFFIGF